MAMQLLRLPETLKKTGLTRSALYAAIAAGSFPKPVKLGQRAVAWPADELDGWIGERIAEREAA
jgi:prophage regulatory protein